MKMILSQNELLEIVQTLYPNVTEILIEESAEKENSNFMNNFPLVKDENVKKSLIEVFKKSLSFTDFMILTAFEYNYFNMDFRYNNWRSIYTYIKNNLK